MPDVIDYFGTGSDAGDYSFLSNFYEHDGWTVEHRYQATKTDDPEWRTAIMRCKTPGQAKKMGRRAPMRPTWDDEKLDVMLTLLREKFSIPELAQQLLGTGDAMLIEGNWWGDRYWGVYKGQGENHLGRLLMQVREEISHDMSNEAVDFGLGTRVRLYDGRVFEVNGIGGCGDGKHLDCSFRLVGGDDD